MNDEILRDIERRLKALERTAVRYRSGEVTDVAPLDVALGGAATPFEDVKSIGPLADGDQVAALLWGNDMLVLGALSGGIRFGSDSMVFSGTQTQSDIVTHGVGATPRCVIVQPIGTSGLFAAQVHTVGATQFTVVMRRADTTHTGTVFYYWLAIA